MLRFQPGYFILAVILFLVEVAIALFVHDQFVRPYFGDFLVVILMYCFLRSFFNLPVLVTAVSVLLFSYLIEVLQYFDLIKALGLENSGFAKTVLGSSFEWPDIVAYTAGITVILLIENRRKQSKS